MLRSEEIPLGYYDRELTKQKRDLKEVFDFMETRQEDDINQWPKEKEFKEAMETFFNKSSNVAEKTLQLVLVCLGLDKNKYIFGDSRTSNARLNFYPVEDPLSVEEKNQANDLGDMALHHHTGPRYSYTASSRYDGRPSSKVKEIWLDRYCPRKRHYCCKSWRCDASVD